jgi:hypothetical protein
VITDFLKTITPKEDLRTTLKVIQRFKACESREEWMGITFGAWAKLEQLEEYIEHLVNGKDLQPDTIEYMGRKQ